MNGWQPIETAPKDGSEILVVEAGADGAPYIAHVLWARVDDYRGAPHGWCVVSSWGDEQGGYQTLDRPTHWMPLPAAPGATPNEKASCVWRNRGMDCGDNHATWCGDCPKREDSMGEGERDERDTAMLGDLAFIRKALRCALAEAGDSRRGMYWTAFEAADSVAERARALLAKHKSGEKS